MTRRARDGRARATTMPSRMLRKVLRTQPVTDTQWSVRTVAAATQIPTSTVQQYFALFGV